MQAHWKLDFFYADNQSPRWFMRTVVVTDVHNCLFLWWTWGRAPPLSTMGRSYVLLRLHGHNGRLLHSGRGFWGELLMRSLVFRFYWLPGLQTLLRRGCICLLRIELPYSCPVAGRYFILLIRKMCDACGIDPVEHHAKGGSGKNKSECKQCYFHEKPYQRGNFFQWYHAGCSMSPVSWIYWIGLILRGLLNLMLNATTAMPCVIVGKCMNVSIISLVEFLSLVLRRK